MHALNCLDAAQLLTLLEEIPHGRRKLRTYAARGLPETLVSFRSRPVVPCVLFAYTRHCRPALSRAVGRVGSPARRRILYICVAGCRAQPEIRVVTQGYGQGLCFYDHRWTWPSGIRFMRKWQALDWHAGSQEFGNLSATVSWGQFNRLDRKS